MTGLSRNRSSIARPRLALTSNMSIVCCWPDGRVKYVHAIAHALQDASGNREFIGAVTDITERKTAEEKIRRNERELRTLIEAMPAL